MEEKKYLNYAIFIKFEWNDFLFKLFIVNCTYLVIVFIFLHVSCFHGVPLWKFHPGVSLRSVYHPHLPWKLGLEKISRDSEKYPG